MKNIPQHIAIILDGNRRWAKVNKKLTLQGHRKGSETFEKLVDYAKDSEIKCLTGWAFSTENWERSDEEVNFLFELIREMVKRYEEKFEKENIRFVHLGRKDRFEKDIREIIENMEEKTKGNDGLTVALGIDYGGHDELIRAFEKMKEKDIGFSKENVEANLDTANLPLVDLIIRTGGEKRLSGFLSWQSAYSEIYFTDTYFPDFGPEELKKAIEDFSKRERRFGGDPSP